MHRRSCWHCCRPARSGRTRRLPPLHRRPPEASSLLGSYLAGRFARTQHDTSAAAKHYRDVLRLDPDNAVVLESSFLMEAADGNHAYAIELARRIVALQPGHRLARMWLATADLRDRNPQGADEHLSRATGGGPIGELTTTLARAWVKLAQGDSGTALDQLKSSRLAETAQTYVRYHRALISDLSGRKAEARKEYEVVFRQDPRTPRLALAYAQHAASGR